MHLSYIIYPISMRIMFHLCVQHQQHHSEACSRNFIIFHRSESVRIVPNHFPEANVSELPRATKHPGDAVMALKRRKQARQAVGLSN